MNQRILVVINKDENSRNVELTLPEIYAANQLKNLINDNEVSVAKSKANLTVNEFLGKCIYYSNEKSQ